MKSPIFLAFINWSESNLAMENFIKNTFFESFMHILSGNSNYMDIEQ